MSNALSPPARLPLGRIHVDVIDFIGTLDRVVALCRAGQGGYVLTPNVDHVCLAEHDDALAQAYADASLSVVDGKPLLWLARAMDRPLPGKVSGSDLIRPLVARAAREGLRVFFLGGVEGVGAKAAEILVRENPGLVVAGVYSPPFGFEKNASQDADVVARIREARTDVLLVALGAPKQELWMHRHRHDLGPAVGLGIGASLDFIAGVVKRAPAWMSDVGLEWAYRLAQEPRRMYHRYLVRDRAFVGIAWRTWRAHRKR